MNTETPEKTPSLAERIQSAKAHLPHSPDDKTAKSDSTPPDGATPGRIAVDITVPIVICGFLGFFADKEFGTLPFLLILGLILGIGAAGMSVWRAFNGYGYQTGYRRKTPTSPDNADSDVKKHV